MSKRTRRTIAAAAAAAAATAMFAGPQVATADDRDRDKDRDDDLKVIGLVDDRRLVRFEVDRPGGARTIGVVRGLIGGDRRLVGIDYRVQDGKLYGVGNAGGIYTIEGRNATKVGQLTIALMGTNFGVDFNPAADALRIISDTGQNLRHPFAGPTAGTTAMDGTLTYPATATAPATTATGVTGAGYTNNDLDANTATTLYDIDTMLDQVVIQSPANAGLLAATGKLGVDASGDVGFDIYSVVRGGKAGDQISYATLKVEGRYRLFEIRLTNGEAWFEGTFDSGKQVRDIAIPLNQL